MGYLRTRLRVQHFLPARVNVIMTKPINQRPASQDHLAKQMSEVISLREKVAQAELAAHLYGITAAERGSQGVNERRLNIPGSRNC
jgi:hypothetical protein